MGFSRKHSHLSEYSTVSDCRTKLSYSRDKNYLSDGYASYIHRNQFQRVLKTTFFLCNFCFEFFWNINGILKFHFMYKFYVSDLPLQLLFLKDFCGESILIKVSPVTI